MLKKILIAAVLAVGMMPAAHAVDITPDFADIPTGWTPDRYEPDVFANIGSYQGRNDVLQIGIHEDQGSANRGSQSGTFYNTQGRQHAAVGGVGDRLSADLYVESAWSNSADGAIRTDMWGVSPSGSGLQYPIVGFANFDGAARFRAWDADIGWVDLISAVNFDAWNSLAIEYTGTSFDFFVNDTLAYSDATINPMTGGFQDVIMQGYNFYDPALGGSYEAVNYEAHWDNSQTAQVSEANMLPLLGIGMIGLGFTQWRRQRRNAA